LDRHERGRHPNSPTRVNTTVIPCPDDAECEKLGAFLADRIDEFKANATGYFDGKLLGGCVRSDAGEAVAGYTRGEAVASSQTSGWTSGTEDKERTVSRPHASTSDWVTRGNT